MKALRHFLQDLAALPRDLKLLAVSIFLWGAGESLFVYIVPLYMERLGASPAQIGNVYGLGAAVMGLSTLPAGILADRWGRKQVMLLGWLTGLLSAAIMAAAANLTWFSVGWVVYWFTGFVLPAISSYVAAGRGRLSPERALTMTYAGFALGNVISPALGGWLSVLLGLRALFLIGAVLAGISTGVVLLLRPQAVTPAEAQPGYRRLLANRRFVGTSLLVAAAWFVMWLGFPLAPNFLADVRGLSAASVGALGSFEALGALTLGLVLGRQTSRRGFLLAQALVVVYLSLLLRAEWFAWIALAYFTRAAALVARTLAEAQAARVVERTQLGLAFGVLETIAAVGTVLAPLLAGRLYEQGPARPFQLSLLLLPVTMLLAYLALPRASPAETELPLEILPGGGPVQAPAASPLPLLTRSASPPAAEAGDGPGLKVDAGTE